MSGLATLAIYKEEILFEKALSPPLIVQREHIEELFPAIRSAKKALY